MFAHSGDELGTLGGCRFRVESDRRVLVRDCGGHAGGRGTPEVLP